MNEDHTSTTGTTHLPVIFLMGPTASGKTALAIKLHQQLGCELISVDSALVYRGLDIGTAKPDAAELEKAPHQLIDICEPDQPYSASKFCLDAKELIEKTIKRNKIPVLVGGTMLYFKALRDGLADLPTADLNIREQIRNEAAELGWEAMHDKLLEIDPESAARITKGDSQRIQRGLEVHRISGKTLSQFFQEQSIKPLPYPVINIAIAPQERANLRERITIRFEQMLAQGFVEEVEGLYKIKGLSMELPAMRSVGYRQVCQYLAGEMDFDTMKEKAITATCRLAKRQMTWLRKWPELNWLKTADPDNCTIIRHLIEQKKRPIV
ncbi:MAG: tRNA (adenosine(37)-N6)-dimethylallyltransferase MiaA [Gammaproteobacteria bacterium]|nr:tRNA (adenosine(37)-N6)-dimethylallyltransferase MiaA [Gammaproteobacteria bacterium]